jgi:ribonucleoside-diphosphate reductase alpha chain
MIYKRRTISGEFILVNKYLRKELLELNLWTKEIRDKIIMNDGSIQNIMEIPEDLRILYKTVWEISMKSFIDQSLDRGQYICQSQSLNLFFAKPEYKKITSALFYSWSNGSKNGNYYIRTKSVAKTQLFTLEPTKKIQEEKEEEICDSCGA